MTNLHDHLTQDPHQLLAHLEQVSSVAMLLIDRELVVRDCNRGFRQLFSLNHKPVGRPVSDFFQLGESNLSEPGAAWKLQFNPKCGVSGALLGYTIRVPDGAILFCERLMLTENRIVEQMTILTNQLINKEREVGKQNRKLSLLKEELVRKVEELQVTLARVKQLEGIIPICMYCKKIRNDKQLWQQLEHYLSEHSEALFSHGLCPECFTREYESFQKNKSG